MIRLALRTIWVRRAAFLASFLALALGGVIVMTCGSLMETGIRKTVPPDRLAAAGVVLTGPRSFAEPVRLPGDDVARAAKVPGVAQAVGDVSFPAYVTTPGGRLVGGASNGHGWASSRLGPYPLAAGTAPTGAGEVVLDAATAERAGAAPGRPVELVLGGERVTARLSGIVRGPAVDGGVVFVSARELDRVAAHPGTVDAIGIITAPGADLDTVASALTGAVRGTSALTGDQRGSAEFSGIADSSETLIVIAAVFGGLAVMVEIFIVAGVLGLSMQQRAREHALLRAVGATPGQLRRLVLGETFLIAVVATAVAYLPFKVLGRALLRQMGEHDVVSPAIEYRAGWIPVAAGTGVALLSAMVAAYVAARPAVRARPVEALSDATLRTRWLSWSRATIATVVLAGAGALTLVTALVMAGPIAASTGGPTAMLWAIGFALLGPGLVRVTFALLRPLVRAVTGATGTIAMGSATNRRVQLAGAVMPIMLATGLGCALIYMQTTQTAVAEDVQTRDLRATVALSSEAGGLPLSLVDTVERVPGVRQATGVVTSAGYLQSIAAEDKGKRDVWPIEGVTAGAAETTGLTLTHGSLSALTGRSVVIPDSELTGQRRVGEPMTVYMGDNTRLSLRIAGSYAAPAGFEQLYLPADLVSRYTRSGLADQILVTADPHVPAAALETSLRRATEDLPGVRLADRAGMRRGVVEQEQTGVWVNYLIVGMIIGYAVISLVNSLVVATAARRREFALQRLVGATRGQIMRMATVEGSVVAVAGALLGMVVAGLTLVAFDIALGGGAWPQGSPCIAVAVFGGSFALTLFTILVTTGHVSRARPVEAAEAV